MFTMDYKIHIILFALFMSFIIAKNNYGPFDISVTNFEVCKGPKSKDCVLTTAWVENGYKIWYKMNVVERMSPTKAKIVSISKTNETVRFQMNKPCDHLFIRPVLQSILNVTQSCVILQGNYTFFLDFQEIFEKYYGGSFLYGSWTFKATFYGNTCNFLCQVMYVTVSPKPKKT